jgi:hypothetical protein
VEAVEPPSTLVLHSIRDPLTGRELEPAKHARLFIDTAWAFTSISSHATRHGSWPELEFASDLAGRSSPSSGWAVGTRSCSAGSSTGSRLESRQASMDLPAGRRPKHRRRHPRCVERCVK